ncbi:MAG: hypothetical protein CMQ38_06675 [Gammaproteobacteria bacterium]|nr:hypothetical protein [Gammaproteobacteria bacterium]
MASLENVDYDFWTHIYQLCLYLEKDSGNQIENYRRLRETLETILETFEKEFDPVDQYSEYVLILFCKTILRNIVS